MSVTELARVRAGLQHRRREILEASVHAVRGIDELRRAERDPEPTEESQSEQVQYDLSRLGEVEQREIAQIDAAIARLDAGEYGRCRTCGEAIDRGRLAALPYVVECAECASGREETEAMDEESKKRPRPMMPG